MSDASGATASRLTPEARASDVGLALGEGRTSILGTLEEARRVVSMGYKEIERQLSGMAHVNQDELDRRALMLSPVLAGAWDNPQRLINLYRARHLEPADRVLIEGVAAGLIDGLESEDGFASRDEWRSLEQELALQRSPEEQEALSDRAALDGLSEYLGNAEQLVGADLALLSPDLAREERENIAIGRSLAEANVNAYERRLRETADSVESAPLAGPGMGS
jgi:hypothetical protein